MSALYVLSSELPHVPNVVYVVDWNIETENLSVFFMQRWINQLLSLDLSLSKYFRSFLSLRMT